MEDDEATITDKMLRDMIAGRAGGLPDGCHHHPNYCDCFTADLAEELLKAREALRFYACTDRNMVPHCAFFEDENVLAGQIFWYGSRARAALGIPEPSRG